MKQIGSLLTAGALALSLVTLPAGAAEAAPALEETAQAAAQAALTAGGAQSIQYALWQDGEIILTGYAGNYSRTENRALTDDILYGVGSVSKTYTAAAVLKLVDEGKVELDAPVTAYLPDFTMADGRYTDITVRMLLNHSSGLPGSTIANGFLLNDPDTLAADTLLEELSSQTLKADPGAFSVYCNDGFTLAELVVEAVSGMDFDDYVRQAILEPAGLEDTWFPGEDFDQSCWPRPTTGRTRPAPSPPRPWASTAPAASTPPPPIWPPSAERCSVRTGFSARTPLPPPWPTSTPGAFGRRTPRMWSPTAWAGTASTGTHLPTAAFRP